MSPRTATLNFGLAQPPPAPTSWLWQGMLAPGKVTLLTSLWKSGKTTLLAHLLAQRRRGGQFLGLAVTAGGSMVLSEEPPDLWPQRRRRFRLGEESGVLSRPFPGGPEPEDLCGLIARLRDLAPQRGIDLVVIDSLAAFLPSRDENSAGGMQLSVAPFAALAEAGLAVWLLHHPSKGEPALGQAARGSGALLAAVDVVLEMRLPAGNPFTRRRRLYGWSRFDETPRQLLIELSGDGGRYERLAGASDEFHDHWEPVRQILGESSVPLTQAEVRAAWTPGLRKPNEVTLWRRLKRAAELGVAVRVGKGTKNDPYRFALPAAREGV